MGCTRHGGGVSAWLAVYRLLDKLLAMHRVPAQWARVAWYAPLHANDPLPFVFGFAEARCCKQLLKILLLLLDWIAVTWFVIGLNHAEFEVLSWVRLHSLVTAALPAGRYVWSVYWSVATPSTVGYGDITPQNIGEMLFWLGAMLVGQMLFADIIGSISLRQSALHSTAFVELDDVEQLKARPACCTCARRCACVARLCGSCGTAPSGRTVRRAVGVIEAAPLMFCEHSTGRMHANAKVQSRTMLTDADTLRSLVCSPQDCRELNTRRGFEEIENTTINKHCNFKLKNCRMLITTNHPLEDIQYIQSRLWSLETRVGRSLRHLMAC